MFFTGSYERTLDGKGRLVLPPKVRTKLPEGGFLVPLNDCLGLYPAEAFKALVDRMTDQVRNEEMPAKALVAFTSSAEEVELDAQGRIGLTPRLRTKVGLDSNDVVVVGASSHVQIWTAARWNEQEDDLTESVAPILDRGLAF